MLIWKLKDYKIYFKNYKIILFQKTPCKHVKKINYDYS